MRLDVRNQLVDLSECQRAVGIRRAIENRDSAGRRVLHRCAGKQDVWHEAGAFVGLLSGQNIVLAIDEDLRGVLPIEQCRANAVDERRSFGKSDRRTADDTAR